MAEREISQARQAYRALERLIVTLALKPGASVNEQTLIDRAGFGRTPVREAIQKLEWQGLVEIRPRAGLRITPIHPDDHGAVMRARKPLEPLVTELAALHADDAQRERLVACAQAVTAASIRPDPEAFIDAVRDFDDIREEACPNRFLTMALAPLQAHARRLWFARADARQMDRAVEPHLRVIRAIGRADGAGAAAAMSDLMESLTA